MDNETMGDIVDEYFDAFQSNDLDRLSELYADNVVLNEWNENVFEGKEAVLAANKSLFEQFSYISITERMRAKFPHTQRCFCEIEVNLICHDNDDMIYVKVIDRITFDSEGKIVKIFAYRGF